MPTPRLYFDACAFIETAKGRFQKGQTADRAAEADMCHRILKAARDGELQVYTSTLTVAEVVHVGDVPVADDVKKYLERLLLSGRDGVLAVEPSPFIVELARDLTWQHGIKASAIDRIHIASAILA